MQKIYLTSVLMLTLVVQPALRSHPVPGTAVVLDIVTRNWSSTGVAYSTTNLSDSNTCDGQVWYVSHSSISGTSPLYRLYSSGADDYLDSVSSTEGSPGYSLLSPSITGYAWYPPKSGMQQFSRGNDSGWHAPLTYFETLSGYSPEGFALYGYNRYNNRSTILDELDGTAVTVKSNEVAGGVVWSWVWNSKEFINTDDYGREMQAALYTYDDSNNTTSDPVEAGSNVGGTGRSKHGSPLVSVSTNNTTHVQSTRAVPLDWIPGDHGGSTTQPVIWPDVVIGKDLTLDFAGYSNVGKYVTHISVPNALDSNTQFEIPTVYLKSDFNRYYTYDATNTGSLTEVFPTDGGSPIILTANAAAEIATTSTGSYAMGIYASTNSTGLSSSTSNGFWLSLYNFQSANCTKINCSGKAALSSGDNTFTAYIVCGTLTQVKSTIDSLHSNGY